MTNCASIATSVKDTKQVRAVGTRNVYRLGE